MSFELELTGDAVKYSLKAIINVCADKSAKVTEHLTAEAKEWFVEQNIEATVVTVFIRRWLSCSSRQRPSQKHVVLMFDNENDMLLCKMRWS